jgi:succinate-semialdehyde dehydrogenase/glutarate-semialdehyde dehydrogenase
MGSNDTTITAEQEAAVIAAVPTGVWLGGHEVGLDTTLKVEDPATGSVLTEISSASAADAERAIDIAAGHQAEWAATAPRQRGEILRNAYELMVERTDDLALLMTLEMGKPLAESRGEVAYAAEFFRWFAEEAPRIDGGYMRNPAGAGRLLVMRQPVGPCYLITPWNFPLAMGTRKLGPAIAAGCTAIVKPAALTPLSMLALGRLLADAGLPEGVLSVMPTSDSGGFSAPILGDPRLRKLSFTGSTQVGQVLLKQAADQVLRTSMELGGNAPFIVFDDADLDAAIEGTMIAKMRNIGEACTAANRLYVHADIAGDYASRLAERMGALLVGRGTEPDVNVGPLVEEKARAGVAELVDDAVGSGADVLTGGGSIDGPGWFYEPTVLTGVGADSRIVREEIFGPVAAIQTFTTEDEVVAMANSTEYGLIGYLFTDRIDRGLRVCEALEFGMVGLNSGLASNPAAPFGGVKQSGLGREGGFTGIDEYLEQKYVFIADPSRS